MPSKCVLENGIVNDSTLRTELLTCLMLTFISVNFQYLGDDL